MSVRVCQAIQHAHQKGIIHRDIKPSNILVTLHDGVPVPKVIDYGIAKAIERRLTEATVYTQLHQFLGTPAYMSPEQAEMSGLDIDTRSDIHSLGVLLYELLTGTTPFDAKELIASGIDAMRRTIREKEPLRPSTRLRQSSLARAPIAGSRVTRHASLSNDLDWIVMKCLEKDRTRRYETANGLVADLRRHLDNEPVVARPPSMTYRLQKAWRRHKVLFALGLLQHPADDDSLFALHRLLTRLIYRVRVQGQGQLPSSGGALLISNHLSLGDAFIFGATSQRIVRFVMHERHYRKPIIGALARLAGVIPMSSEQRPRDLVRSLRAAADAIRQGELVCIFTSSAEVIASCLRQCDITTVISSQLFLDKVKLDLPFPALRIEVIAAQPSAGERLTSLAMSCLLPVRWVERSLGCRRPVGLDDLATVIFSSGSTGDPKGVLLSHFNLAANVDQLDQVFHLTARDRLLGTLPLFHSFGFMGTLCLTGALGVGVAYHPTPLDAEAVGRLVREYELTFLLTTPTFLQLNLRGCAPEDFGSLRVVLAGAEKLPERLATAFEERFGIRPLEGYGCTECAPAVAVNTPGFRAAGFRQVGTKNGKIGGEMVPHVKVEEKLQELRRLAAHRLAGERHEHTLSNPPPSCTRPGSGSPRRTTAIASDASTSLPPPPRRCAEFSSTVPDGAKPPNEAQGRSTSMLRKRIFPRPRPMSSGWP